MLNKKICASFQRIIELLPKILSLNSQKYGFGIRDPGSKKKPIPDHISRIQGSKRHRIPDPDPQHWFLSNFCDEIGEVINFFVKVLLVGINLLSVGFQRHSFISGHTVSVTIVHCNILCCWSDGVLLEVWTRAHRSQAGLQVQPTRHGKVSTREMENIRRGPTFRDFITIRSP